MKAPQPRRVLAPTPPNIAHQRKVSRTCCLSFSEAEAVSLQCNSHFKSGLNIDGACPCISCAGNKA